MNQHILKNNYYKIITNISLIYLENEKLQKKYDDMMFNWVQKKRKVYEEHKEKQQKSQEKPKEKSKEKPAEPMPDIPETNKKEKPKDLKHDEIINSPNFNEDEQLPKNSDKKYEDKQQKSKQENKIPKKSPDDYDQFEFFTPENNQKFMNNETFNASQTVKKNVIFRKKASKKLKKILKKIYKKLLIKLHPDRCKLKDAEKKCRDLVKSYKSNDFIYFFHMVKITEIAIHLNLPEIKCLIDFLFEELRRVQIKNNLLKKSIADLK